MIGIRTEVKVGFGDNLRKAADAMGITVTWLLRDQMRLLFQDLIKITAPSKKVIQAKAGGDWPTDRKIGEQAIFGDLNKVFWMTPNEDLGRGARRKRLASMQQAAQFHERNRSKSTGRTKRPFGGDAPNGEMFLRQDVLLKYAKAKYKEVGKLKASWVRPMLAYQAKVGGRASVPSWVSRHAGKGRVSVSETIAAGQVAAITARNSTNMISRKIDGSAINAAMRTREKDLAGQVLKRKDRIVAQFNANQTPKPATGQAA
jgi:hypothetical protein